MPEPWKKGWLLRGVQESRKEMLQKMYDSSAFVNLDQVSQCETITSDFFREDTVIRKVLSMWILPWTMIFMKVKVFLSCVR